MVRSNLGVCLSFIQKLFSSRMIGIRLGWLPSQEKNTALQNLFLHNNYMLSS